MSPAVPCRADRGDTRRCRSQPGLTGGTPGAAGATHALAPGPASHARAALKNKWDAIAADMPCSCRLKQPLHGPRPALPSLGSRRQAPQPGLRGPLLRRDLPQRLCCGQHVHAAVVAVALLRRSRHRLHVDGPACSRGEEIPSSGVCVGGGLFEWGPCSGLGPAAAARDAQRAPATPARNPQSHVALPRLRCASPAPFQSLSQALGDRMRCGGVGGPGRVQVPGDRPAPRRPALQAHGQQGPMRARVRDVWRGAVIHGKQEAPCGTHLSCAGMGWCRVQLPLALEASGGCPPSPSRHSPLPPATVTAQRQTGLPCRRSSHAAMRSALRFNPAPSCAGA